MERLKIRHFGPVKDLDIDILPLTLFIGTQGCGKSTISKVLTICRDMNWILALLKGKEDVMQPFSKFCISEYFYNDTFIRYERQDDRYNVIITYENGGFYIDTLGISRDELGILVQKMIVEANRDLLAQLGETDLSNPDVMQKYSRIISANARTMLYVPAERNLVGTMSTSLASMLAAQIPLYDALVEYMSVFEKAKHYLKTYDVDFLKSSFSIKEGKERIVFTDSVTGEMKSLPLQASSSGLQSVLPLVMVMDYSLQMRCFNSFVIEEPEQNLFPTNQRALLKFILSRFTKLFNVVITTHSPYMLSCLNVFLLAGRILEDYGVNAIAEGGLADDFVYLKSGDVAVYSLDPEDSEYCKSLIDTRTHMIGINHLDMVSDVIGEEYGRLYHYYLKLKRQ